MCGRRLLVCVAGTLILTTPARAFEMRWASGATEIHTENAALCTLIVRCTDADASFPNELRILYTGESYGNAQLEILADGEGLDIAEVCEVIDNVTTEDRLSRTQVVNLCTSNIGRRVRDARFIVNIPSGFQGRLTAVPVTCEGSACPDRRIGIGEVTVNGGTTRPYPPLLLAAHARQDGGEVTVIVSGVGLSDVQAVTLASESSNTVYRLAIAAKTDTLLVVVGRLNGPVDASHLEVIDGIGAVGSISTQLEVVAPAIPVRAGDYVLVRFRSDQVQRPPGSDTGSLDSFRFVDPSLRDRLGEAGITELAPIFPWFKPENVHAANLIGEPVELEDLSQYYYGYVSAGADIAAVVGTLKDHDGVLWTGPDYGGKGAQFMPNDTLFARQWGLRNTGQTLCGQTPSFGVDIGAVGAWDRTMGAPSVRVAVLDTGIDTTHTEWLNADGITRHVRAGPAFVSPVKPTSFDDHPGRHGTAVAGIVAATGDNTNAIAGIAWQVEPWAIKVLRGDDSTFTRASWVSQGISWSTANGMPIICMALGMPEAPCPGAGSWILADSANIMNVACLNALYAGQLPIASMGNCDGQIKHWPAAFDKRVYAVGAEYFSGVRWEDCLITSGCSGTCLPNQTTCLGSSIGPWIDAVAPGGRLIVTLGAGPNSVNNIGPTCNPGNLLVGQAFGGTSASAGFTAGIAALQVPGAEPSW